MVSEILQERFDKEVEGKEKAKAITELVKRIKKRSIENQIKEHKKDGEMLSKLMVEKARINNLSLDIK